MTPSSGVYLIAELGEPQNLVTRLQDLVSHVSGSAWKGTRGGLAPSILK